MGDSGAMWKKERAGRPDQINALPAVANNVDRSIHNVVDDYISYEDVESEIKARIAFLKQIYKASHPDRVLSPKSLHPGSEGCRHPRTHT